MLKTRRIEKSRICIIVVIILLSLGCQDPPDGLLRDAESAVRSAAAEKASTFAGEEYRRAEDLLQKGRLEVAHQKGRLAPLRDYTLADSLLTMALRVAGEAVGKARDSVGVLEARAASEIAELRDEVKVWHEALNGSLAAITAGEFLSKADLALTTSHELYAKDEFEAAIKMVLEGRISLAALGEVISENDENERREIVKWRRWIDETLEKSRKEGSVAIIVDKSAHRLFLVKNGSLSRIFDCEIGYNSVGHKLFAGDGATPEGKYHITELRRSGSKYYKALPLDYPNGVDRRLFHENKANGTISRRARIGAFIEIHGEGGRGYDWTNGCIALRNDEIDRLMRHVTVGTPVTIVRRSDIWPRQ